MGPANILLEEKPLANFEDLTVTLVGDEKYDFFSCANAQFPVEEIQKNVALDVLGSGSLVSWGMSGKTNLVANQIKGMSLQNSAVDCLKPGVSLYMAGMVTPTDNFPDETSNLLGKKYADKLIGLESKIGTKQFEKLSFSQQIFMANTFGAINLGEDIDIQSVYKKTQDE